MKIIQRLESFKEIFRKNDSIALRYNDILEILELINKPVETESETLSFDFHEGKYKILDEIKKLVKIKNKTIEDLEHTVDNILNIIEKPKTNEQPLCKCPQSKSGCEGINCAEYNHKKHSGKCIFKG